MLTKGDVLAALGKIKHAKGSMKGIPKTVYGVSAGYGDVSGRAERANTIDWGLIGQLLVRFDSG